jgi:hypothetical protein
VGVKIAVGVRVLVGVGVSVFRLDGVLVLVRTAVGLSVGNRVIVAVNVGVGVIVQVAVRVQNGDGVNEGVSSTGSSVVAGSMVAVLVGGAMISVGREIKLPGDDQIAGPLT